MFRSINIKIIFFLLIFFLSPKVNALVEPTPNFYVNDYANILSENTESYIINQSKKLDDVDGTQIVVVTIHNLGDYSSIEAYANALFRKFGIGDSEKNNGLLLLLALEERLFRVEVGYGLEGILPDGKTGRFQDEYIIPYLKNNEWDVGIKNGYDAFYKEIVEQNGLQIEYNEPVFNSQSDSRFEIFGMFLSMYLGIILGIIAKFLKEKKSLFITIYFFVVATVLILGNSIFKTYAFINAFFFIISLISSFSSSSKSYRGSSRRSFSSGGSFYGGGGSSGGGGSTRGF